MQTLIIKWQHQAEANKLQQKKPTASFQELTEHIKLPSYKILVIQRDTT